MKGLVTLSPRRRRERRMDALESLFESMRDHISRSTINRLDADRHFTLPFVLAGTYGHRWPTCECGAPLTPFPNREDAQGDTSPCWMCVLCYGRYLDGQLRGIDKQLARFDPIFEVVA